MQTFSSKSFSLVRLAMMAGLAATVAMTSGCALLNPPPKLPIVTDVPEGASPQFQGVVGAVSYKANPNVQVFTLDGTGTGAGTNVGGDLTVPPSAMMTGAGAMEPPSDNGPSVLAMQGVPYGKDGDVQVFPFTDQVDVGNLPATNALMPNLPPPASSNAPFASPFAANGWHEGGGDSTKIFFANGSSRISVSGRDAINQVAANTTPGQLVRVEGHASKRALSSNPVTRHMVNLKMSMQRALHVSQALIKKGVPAPNIKTTAWGDTQPPMLTDPGMDEEAASRRVDIFTQ